MLREFCSENLVNVKEAIGAGALRIELCDNLSVGGITPADATIKGAVSIAHGLGATVMVMVRPRGGSFAYSEEELRAMERTIATAAEYGADGVVFGCLCDHSLDEGATQRLANRALGLGLDVTFHMAFDELGPHEQLRTLGVLAQMGVSRVLTHGGPLGKPIEQCLPRLRNLAQTAGDRITIMPGGGVTWQNAGRIARELGTDEVHGTRIVRW